jgi:hypothetical protein
MSMDLIGLRSKSEKGKHFKNSNWAWFPLWNYVQHVAPSVASKVLFPFENAGDGLRQEDAEELAEILKEMITSGHTSTYSDAFDVWKNSDAWVDCVICMGRGYLEIGQTLIETNDDDSQTSQGLASEMPCPSCIGLRKKPAKALLFSTENVEKFIEFLEACGGFEIR